MHPTQKDILESLRRVDSRRFGELLWEIGETSDNLTYHLKKLQKNSLIESPMKGIYTLADKGVMYLNNNLELERDLFPTVSCMLELYGSNSTVLVMRKLKKPNLGSIHLPTFGVESSMNLTTQINGFLRRYHVTATNLSFKKIYRERTKNNAGQLFFDKFFVVFSGTFSTFEDKIHDREFMEGSIVDLVNDPLLLSASKDVLADIDGIFTEKVNFNMVNNSPLA